MIKVSEARKLSLAYALRDENAGTEMQIPQTPSPHVGVEIEFISSIGYGELAELFSMANLSQHIEIDEDGSITRMENGYAVELKLLAPEKKIKRLVEVAIALIEPYATINDSCGLHVHLDMRHRNSDLCFKRLVKAQPLLFGVSDKGRLSNNYCKPVPYSASNIGWQNYDDGAYNEREDRYYAVNALAFEEHSTIEVRVFDATLDAKIINARIDLLLQIIKKDIKDNSFLSLRRQLPRLVYNQTKNLVKKFKNEDWLKKLESKRVA